MQQRWTYLQLSLAQGEWKRRSKRITISNRAAINAVDFHLPNGDDIRMALAFASLLRCSALHASKTMTKHWINNETGEVLKPNMEEGFYQPVDANGEFTGNTISALWLTLAMHNFERSLERHGIKEPFISIFIWTVIFSVCTVEVSGLILLSGLYLQISCNGKSQRSFNLPCTTDSAFYAVPAFTIPFLKHHSTRALVRSIWCLRISSASARKLVLRTQFLRNHGVDG